MSFCDHKATRGAEGEEALNLWFQQHQLPFVSICQNKDTFAHLFPGHLKRPDFLLLMPSLGTLAVDAKNHTLSGGVFTLPLENELRRSVSFERLFRLPVWYAYMDPTSNGEAWYWISALKAIEVGLVRTNQQSQEEFLAIPLQEFTRLEHADDLAKLYQPQLLSVQHISGLPLSS